MFPMLNPYPVIEIQHEWVLEPEALGTKEKFWYRQDQGESDWLFKYPHQKAGQHWAEKIAAEIAACLDIPHAQVELAIFQGKRGSTTKSFAQNGQSLFHGNQIMAGHVFDYNPAVKYGQSDHTLGNIFLALDKFSSPEGVFKTKIQFAGYLVLDAVIGNTDRHHENWGILLEKAKHGWIGMLAPTFDQASSLGRELLDGGKGKCRQQMLDKKRVGVYAEQARGAIYWNKKDQHGLSPLALVRRATELHPEIFKPALDRVERLDRAGMETILRCVPEHWMTPLERQFSVELVCYNTTELGRIQ